MRCLRLLIVATAVLTPACDSDGEPGSGDGDNEAGEVCAASSDCRAGLGCLGPDDPPVCGVAPHRECVTNEDCFDGGICHAIADGCSPNYQGSRCGEPCAAGQCGPGFHCADSGACEAVACTGNEDCAAIEICDPSFDDATPVYQRNSGCRPIVCNDSGECPTTAECVNGRCQSDFGLCAEQIQVP